VALYEVDCDEVLRDLEAFIDGELPKERAMVVAEHLEACAPCFGHGEFRRRVRVVVRKKCGGAVEMPPHLMIRIRQAIRAEPPG
jgi:anti-sigma factor (TIGR02949 family)